MIKEKYEIKEYVVVDRVCVGKDMFCDVCKNEIKHGNGYWHVHTWHNDWGNDSCESHEYFDVCSMECLKDKFDEYCHESKSYHDTAEIHVEHSTW